MKIRTIKKLAKTKRLHSRKLMRQFSKSIKYNKSIRNACIRGAIMNGHLNFAAHLMITYDMQSQINTNWIYYNNGSTTTFK